jgi:hypothetical protein
MAGVDNTAKGCSGKDRLDFSEPFHSKTTGRLKQFLARHLDFPHRRPLDRPGTLMLP